MAQTSRKEYRLWFNSKESTAGTRDTFEFFEARSMTGTFPATTYMRESDMGKLGAGEHGTQAELQACYTPWSYTAQRLSEVAYFMSYCLGRTDTVECRNHLQQAYNHQLKPLAVTSRTMPTFSHQYSKQAATAAESFTYNICNDISLTLATGGNGLIDFTANGFGNLHYDNSGVLTRNATVNNSSFSSEYSFSAEPLVNYKCCKVWYGDSLESTPLVQASVDMENYNLSNPTEITSVIDSINITINNGMSAEDLLRAGGCGVINNAERGDRTITLEIALRKDTDFDAISLADTQKAIEIQFLGPAIGGGYRYGMKFFFPVVQIDAITQDDSSPIVETIPFMVFEDSNRDPFYCYVNSKCGIAYNDTGTSGLSSSSISESESSVSGL